MTWRGCKPFSKEHYKEFEWLKTSRGTLSGCFKGYLGRVEAFRSCSRVNSIMRPWGILVSLRFCVRGALKAERRRCFAKEGALQRHERPPGLAGFNRNPLTCAPAQKFCHFWCCYLVPIRWCQLNMLALSKDVVVSMFGHLQS